jgi:DNA-binding response OmpR family regulator
MDAKVMLVDDDQMIRDSVEALFESEDMMLLTAESGAVCIAHLEAGFRGVILMDVMMPGMNGWDTIRAIVDRGLFEGNILVMLTALGEPDDAMEGIHEYVTDYLTKPFNPSDLLERLEYYEVILNSLETDDEL